MAGVHREVPGVRTVTALPTPSVPSHEQLRHAAQEAERERLSRFGAGPLLWLAALPKWSRPLAWAAGFDHGAWPSLPGLLGDLAGAGLIDIGEETDREGELLDTFWLATSQRPGVAALLRGSVPAPAVRSGV